MGNPIGAISPLVRPTETVTQVLLKCRRDRRKFRVVVEKLALFHGDQSTVKSYVRLTSRQIYIVRGRFANREDVVLTGGDTWKRHVFKNVRFSDLPDKERREIFDNR